MGEGLTPFIIIFVSTGGRPRPFLCPLIVGGNGTL